MSIFYDLKRTLLQKFLELVPTAVASEVVFSTPVTAVGTVGKECFVTLTAGTESRTFAVDRSDLAVLFQSHDPVPTPIDTTSDVAMLRELTQKLSARFGLPLEANDIADLKLPKPYGTVHVKASAESVRYKGEFKAHVIFGDMPQYPIPFHEFLFNDNSTENTGTSLLPIALGFQQTSADPLLVSFPQIGLLGDNVSIDLSSSFTLDFVVKLPSITGDLVLFSTDPTATTLTTPAFGFRNGRFCVFNDTDFTVGGAWDKASVAVTADTPTRITLRCLTGSATLVIDGVAQGKFPITNQTAKLYGIGTSDPAYGLPTIAVSIGSLRYWASGLYGSSMNELLGDSYVEIANPYPSLTMPTFGWGFDDANMFNSVGVYSDVAPLSGNEFEVLGFEGEKYFSPKLNMGELPLSMDVKRDFTLDFEIVASTYDSVSQYGSILSSIRTSNSEDLTSHSGELVTWRNISAENNNAPVMPGVGYGSAGNSYYRPGLGDFKTRFTLRRSGNLFTWWRNGEKIWAFTSTVKPAAWRFFGSVLKRKLHLGRRFAFWNSALPDASMAVLFGRPAVPLPQALHYWPLDTDTRNLGSDGTAMPGVWSPHVAASKSFMKPNTSVVLPTTLALNTAGEYTIDFEVSYNPGGGYGAFLSTTTWDSLGAFTYHAGNLYHYLVTPSSSTIEWRNQPVVSIAAPVRYTIVAKRGIEYWYINGELKFQHASYGPGSLLLRGIQAGVGLRMFSYWPTPLTDDELLTLFSRTSV